MLKSVFPPPFLTAGWNFDIPLPWLTLPPCPSSAYPDCRLKQETLHLVKVTEESL